jgi:hypothetical protein
MTAFVCFLAYTAGLNALLQVVSWLKVSWLKVHVVLHRTVTGCMHVFLALMGYLRFLQVLVADGGAWCP